MESEATDVTVDGEGAIEARGAIVTNDDDKQRRRRDDWLRDGGR